MKTIKKNVCFVMFLFLCLAGQMNVASAQSCDPKFSGLTCAHSAILFSANALGFNNWEWDFGDSVGTSTKRDPLYVYGKAGTFKVKLTTTGPTGQCVKEIQITLMPGPDAPIIRLDSKKILVSTGGKGSKHLWFRNDTLISGLIDSTFEAIKPGKYYCKVEGSNGCSSDTSNHINIFLSVNDLSFNKAFLLYPNPAHGKVYLQSQHLSTNDIVAIQVLTLQGKEVKFEVDQNPDGHYEVTFNSAAQNLVLVVRTTQGVFSTFVNNM